MNDMATMWESLQGSMGVHIPQLLGALAIFIVGWIVAMLVRAGARRGLGALKINERFSGNTGQRVDIEGVVGLVLFWLVLLLTLAAVFNALNLSMVSGSFAALTTQIFDYAPKLLAAGLTTLLGIQAFIIIAGVTRLLPLTGVTLPFISYGGSSLVANYVLLALLLRISDDSTRRINEGRANQAAAA